jgi:hypothetical protein
MHKAEKLKKGKREVKPKGVSTLTSYLEPVKL